MAKAGEILCADAFMQIAQHVRQLTAGQDFAGALEPLRAAFGGGTPRGASFLRDEQDFPSVTQNRVL